MQLINEVSQNTNLGLWRIISVKKSGSF